MAQVCDPSNIKDAPGTIPGASFTSIEGESNGRT